MAEESTKLEVKRICSVCDSDWTSKGRGKRKDGTIYEYAHWSKDGHGGWLCKKCRDKYIDHPKTDKEKVKANNARRIAFKGRIKMVEEPPRIGVCNLCRAVAPFDCRLTQMNHYSYHEDNPLKDALEVCVPCHRRYHIELKWQLKDKECIACNKTVEEYKRWFFNEPTPHIICEPCFITLVVRHRR